MTTTTEVGAETQAKGAALACISVHRASDGSYDHYYSLDWVPPWKPVLAWRYRANFARHLASQPPGRVWTETPHHPLPFRRPRRRRA